MTVQAQIDGDTRTMQIEGTLCIPDVALLKKKILDTLESCESVVLDLSSVDDCDTAGIQLLVAASRISSERGKTILIGRYSEPVRSTATKLGVKLMTTDNEKGA